MESNENTNYEEGEQQLRKRKFNELANDGQAAAEEGTKTTTTTRGKLEQKEVRRTAGK
jgi:hypothetical protein